MITPYQASQIAQAMASITMITLEPAYRAEFKAKGAHVRARAGRGAKTYHQKDGSQHMLTFGPRMVSDKVDGDSSGWLSAREIKRYRYYDGDQTVTSLLAHTILHEFAHALQTLAGEQFVGQVIRLCGGRNIFADAVSLAPKVGIESVLERDPQAIVASGMGDERPDWLDDWRDWPGLQAVENEHLFFVAPDIIQRATMRVLDGATTLCRQLESVRRDKG